MMLAFGPCFKQGRHRRDGKYKQLRDDNSASSRVRHRAQGVTASVTVSNLFRTATSTCWQLHQYILSAHASDILRERNYKTISEPFVTTYRTLCNQGLQSHVRVVYNVLI